jgi:ribosomal protein S8
MFISAYKLKSLVYLNQRKMYIISTAAFGIVSSDTAIKNNVGGELLCEVSFI